MSHTQRAMLQIGNFLIALALALALIMVAVRVYRDIVIADDWGIADALNILQFVLILLVASACALSHAARSFIMTLRSNGIGSSGSVPASRLE